MSNSYLKLAILRISAIGGPAKALSLKIRHMLPLIVRPEKTGFIKSRYILDNIIVVWEGMEWARKSKQKAIFLKIDFAKAYDRIEWPFILAML